MTKPCRGIPERRGGRVAVDPRDERGFSLIELLIVLVILPLFVGAISLAIIASYKNQVGVSARLTDSADSQSISAFYARDVQSAQEVTSSASANTPGLCGSGTKLLLGAEWNSGTTIVSYWETTVTAGANTTYELVRSFCQANAAATSVILARDISSGQAPASISCAQGCSATNGWIPAAGVSGVNLVVSAPGSNFGYHLFAAPRAWTPQIAGFEAGGSLPVLLLSQSGLALVVNGSSNKFEANGTMIVDSSSNGAVTVNGSSNQLTSTTSSLDIYSCRPSSCPQLSSTGSGNQATTPSQLTTQVTDPYASLPNPSTAGLTAGSCSTVGKTETCSPGIYQGLSISGSSLTLNFTAGNYLFQGGLSMSGSSNTMNFGGGTYSFQGGFSVSGSSNSLASQGGVLFYLQSGALSISGSSTSAQLSPQTTGTYAGILVFQDRNNSSAMTINGSSNQASSYSGTIYAPAAAVTLNGSSGSIEVGSLITSSLTENGSSGTICVAFAPSTPCN